jgi:hypothetical protein
MTTSINEMEAIRKAAMLYYEGLQSLFKHDESRWYFIM